jgi:DNA-binding SARP family transcriptional activator
MDFFVLGPLEVVGPRGQVQINAGRRTALLAALLLHARRPVLVSTLVDCLWPDDPPQSAVQNIRTYISGLRRMLAEAGDRSRRLTSHSGAYRLSAGLGELDLLRFVALSKTADRAMSTGDHVRAALAAEKAIALWRGRPLADLDVGPTLGAKAAWLEERYWATFCAWIDARFAFGHHADMVPLLRQKVIERPLSERLWACLATALYKTGRTGDALETCTEAHRTFVDQLGIPPGPEIGRTQAAILRGDPLEGAPGQRAQLQAAVVPRQLPPRTPDFVGRKSELRRLMRLSESVAARKTEAGPSPVVTLSGPPGIGKSALAVTAAVEASPCFPDGQIFISLHGSDRSPRPPEDALETALAGLGMDAAALPHDREALQSLYRSVLADRRMMVVLDDAVDAAHVRPLLPGCGRSLALVSSRQALFEIEAQERIRLSPLNEDQALHLLADLAGSGRVAAEPVASRSIIRACGGLPLALRIAGLRLAAGARNPLSFLANRLAENDARLDELSLGELTVRSRFRTSYQSLDETTRAVFRRLGLLPPGGITVRAVAGLVSLDEPEAGRVLERLLQHGLLIAGQTVDGSPAYQMPVLLHDYARELSAG